MAGATALRELTRVPSGDVACAVPSDDAELRALLRRSVVPGAVRVAFTREPSFFAADGMAGSTDTTVVARADGRLVGMGRASVLPLMRNGQPSRIGYLAALRVDGETAASPRLIRDGYALLHRETEGTADGFFTSIATDNERARYVLERGGRLGIPAYTQIAHLVTLVAPVPKRVKGQAPNPIEHDELSEFLTDQSRHYQLGLPWDDAAWSGLTCHDVRANDFEFVRRDGALVGAAAIWDQRAFRQTMIDGYDRALARALPLVNALNVIRGLPGVPAPGAVLNQGAILGGFTTRPEEWRSLWPALVNRARGMGLSWLTICRDARDPELTELRSLTRSREYLTTLYDVAWRDGARWAEPWGGRLFRPEVGLL